MLLPFSLRTLELLHDELSLIADHILATRVASRVCFTLGLNGSPASCQRNTIAHVEHHNGPLIVLCLLLIELLVLLLLAKSGRCRVVQNVISMGILALLSILVIVVSLQLGAR